ASRESLGPPGCEKCTLPSQGWRTPHEEAGLRGSQDCQVTARSHFLASGGAAWLQSATNQAALALWRLGPSVARRMAAELGGAHLDAAGVVRFVVGRYRRRDFPPRRWAALGAGWN